MCARTLRSHNKAREHNPPTSPDCKDNGGAAVNLDSEGYGGVCDAVMPGKLHASNKRGQHASQSLPPLIPACGGPSIPQSTLGVKHKLLSWSCGSLCEKSPPSLSFTPGLV